MSHRLLRRGTVILSGLILATGITAGTMASAASAAPAPSTALAAPATSMTTAAWKFYLVKNINSGLCLTVSGYSTDAGATMVQEGCTTRHHQEWASPAGSSTGYYHIVNYHSGKCLAVNGTRKPVYQSVCSHNHAEDWYAKSVSNGVGNIVNRHTGQCLAVNGANKAAGASIIQWRCNDLTYQRWSPIG